VFVVTSFPSVISPRCRFGTVLLARNTEIKLILNSGEFVPAAFVPDSFVTKNNGLVNFLSCDNLCSVELSFVESTVLPGCRWLWCGCTDTEIIL